MSPIAFGCSAPQPRSLAGDTGSSDSGLPLTIYRDRS